LLGSGAPVRRSYIFDDQYFRQPRFEQIPLDLPSSSVHTHLIDRLYGDEQLARRCVEMEEVPGCEPSPYPDLHYFLRKSDVATMHIASYASFMTDGDC